MTHSLPVIYSAGLFDSSVKFPGITKTQPRIVETYELEYFFADGGVTFINGKEYPIRAGKLLFARPGDIRCSCLPFRCRFIHFDIPDPELQAAVDTKCPVFTGGDPSRIEKDFETVAGLFYSSDPFDKLAASAELISLLHRINAPAPETATPLVKAQKYMEQNYKTDLSVAHIAGECGVSPSYLHRLFQTVLHTTPGDFLLNCRLSAACAMLVNTTLPLSEIASECGFNSPSYFSDCFKREIGVTPGKFRQNAAYPL